MLWGSMKKDKIRRLADLMFGRSYNRIIIFEKQLWED
jgi:hypothetical protein